MHLIATHENTDFDALAACVAAQKLSPGSIVGLARRFARGVRAYWSLHQDRFLAKRLTAIDPGEVTELTLVDLRDRRRLRHVEAVLARRDAGEAVTLNVYDHHPSTSADVRGDLHVVEPLGAITTALVERLRARATRIDAAEATLFALGIHADTGSLTLGHTTPRDARAVAWLLERGADLSMIDRYLHPPLSDAQRDALLSVLAEARRETVNGVEIGVACLKSERSIDGLAEVTSEARRLGGFDALLTILEVEHRGSVQVVGRSRSALVDVGSALRAIGGGGHRGAASAVVKRRKKTGAAQSERVLAQVLDAMRENPPTPRVVGEAMSRPTRTLEPTMSLEEAWGELTRWGVHGAPVVGDGRVVGVVSVRDIARARDAGRGALPIASHMSGQVLTTTSTESLERALELMVEHDVGRLPVLEEGTLIGIVTRSDLRRCLYGELSCPQEAR